MAIVPIRSDNAYVGIAKQSGQGVPNAPTNFIRWLDGTKFEFELKTDTVWEGDGSRRLSQLYKKSQWVKGTLEFNPRPIEIGFFENAAMGINADNTVAPSASTTISASTIAGANAVTVASNTGLTGTGTLTMVLSPGTTNEEVATFSLPATGAGPYTLALNSGTLKNAHTSADGIRSYALHTITDQYDVPYYTLEFGLGTLNGGAGVTVRVTDCKVNTINRSSKAGELLVYKIEFIGISSVSQATPSTVVMENHAPFIFSQTNGGWTLNGSTTGDANAVTSFEIDQKNNLDTSIQTEQLTLGALIAGNVDMTVKADVIMQNHQLVDLAYWGAVGGTTDAQAIGVGNMTVVFKQPDNFHQITYTIATLHYDKITEPVPKKDGKHFSLGIQATSVSAQGANSYVLSVAVQNAQTTQY